MSCDSGDSNNKTNIDFCLGEYADICFVFQRILTSQARSISPSTQNIYLHIHLDPSQYLFNMFCVEGDIGRACEVNIYCRSVKLAPGSRFMVHYSKGEAGSWFMVHYYVSPLRRIRGETCCFTAVGVGVGQACRM